MKIRIHLVLDNIRSLHNVGSIFRTADAFGVSKIYLCGYTAAPVDRTGQPVKEIAKTALGAEKTVPWEKKRQTWQRIEQLKKDGFFVIALENNVPGSIPIRGILRNILRHAGTGKGVMNIAVILG